MSIPRLAIQRPITMFMISAVITLLGAISLMRLPVDLMPDVTYPSITVRVNYGGVGPEEIEQLIVRPLEQALAAVPGLEQINSTASEGSGTVRLNFAWGSDLSEAADEVRTRVDRVRGRLPEEADPPTIFKFDASASPIMGLGVAGTVTQDRVALRELAENELVPRFERIEGVAAVTVDGGLRRQIHIELSKEKITALDLSVDRIISIIRSENQNVPLGEVDEGDTTYLLRSQGEFRDLAQISNLVINTRGGVPVYLRDIAEVKDTTEDLRSFRRINGAPGVRMLVVPGSRRVKRQAEERGLDRVFREAGAEWRDAGCSMCLAMNRDRLEPGQYAVSTTNRNFEGRQGPGGRTFLASPLTAAASAVAGRIADVREML